MSRVVLHCDLNAYYASVEALYRPALRGKPFVVGGDEQMRHGIVLTKSPEAKKCGVQTGMSLMEARKLCPGLLSVTPDMPRYLHISKLFHQMLGEYSDSVEAYGLDESWIEISNPGVTIEDGKRVADEIRARTKDELGLTCSVGVSFTKPLSKLGSDYKKPDATTVLSRENFRQIAWTLPASDLLFVGPATAKTLAKYGILTIGDLAMHDPEWIGYKLGKNGLLVQSYARGEDMTPVQRCDVVIPAKSVGNSTTLPRDAVTLQDIKATFAILADSVAHRLREAEFRSRCISIGVRNTDLSWEGCQRAMKFPTCLASDLLVVAMDLFIERNYARLFPIRGVALRCTQLSHSAEPIQTDIFFDMDKYTVKERLEKAIRALQERFGQKSVQLGVMMADKKIAKVNPKELHVAPAAPYYH